METSSVWTRPLNRRAVVLGLVVICLNLFDVFCTLRHLEKGGEELNPLMQMALQHGPWTFIAVKHILASIGVFALVVYANTIRWSIKCLWALVVLYTLLGIWQCVLFTILK